MYRLVVLFLAYAGVRFGEMAALRVSRLDLRRQRAVIAESVTPLSGQGMVWGTTKSHKRREVPIPMFLVDELRAHVARKRPSDLVFHGIRNGAPLRVSTFRLRFGAGAEAIGIPGLHPHLLRHTAASPRDRVRGRCEGGPADAGPQLGNDDAGHLRAPLRGSTRRSR